MEKQIAIKSVAAELGTIVEVDGKAISNVVNISYRHNMGDVARLDIHCIATEGSEITGSADVNIYQIPLEVMIELQMLRKIVADMSYAAREREAARRQALHGFMARFGKGAGKSEEATEKEKETSAAVGGADALAQSVAASDSEGAVDGTREERNGVDRERDS